VPIETCPVLLAVTVSTKSFGWRLESRPRISRIGRIGSYEFRAHGIILL